MSPSIIISLLGTFVFAVFTIFAYYTGLPRIEDIFPAIPKPGALGFIFYYFMILLPISGYLYFKYDSKNRSIGSTSIIAYFLWVLFVTAWFTFGQLDTSYGSTGQRFGMGMQLFFHILKYLIPLLLLGIIFMGSGSWIIKKIGISESTPSFLYLPMALGIGWSIFVLQLAVLGFFGWYTLITFYTLITLTIAISYKEIWNTIKSIPNLSFNIWEDRYATLRLVINCILLTTLFVVISTNFANVVRPYPIGWDDLGVYMNYPKLIALSESTLNLGIIMWQTFAGIGFLHHNATFAFFLNQFGSIFAILGIWAGIRYFSQKHNPIASLPLLSATIFMSLPMIVFQQAKDMKLDSGLFGISILAVVALFVAFEQKEGKIRNLWYVVAGGLIGIAFGIKITTLMLIIAGVAVLFYRQLGIFWLFSYLSMFIGLFTSLRLWDLMNVNYPKDSPHLLTFWVSLMLLGAAGSWLLWRAKKIPFGTINKTLLIPIALVALGFISTFWPWLIKNGIEASRVGSVSMSGLIWWDAKSFAPDFTKILSQERLDEIAEASRQNSISKDGKTLNEDLGRYFGYETGLNNFLKLPVNLTLQTNQKGEFTDISYIFLALLPGLLLLRFRNQLFLSIYGVYLLGLFILYFFKVPALNVLLSSIQLPFGYIFILFLGLLPITLLHYDNRLPESETEDKKFLSLLAFVTVYTLIFIVAAYGIVWYGILMYFGFLAIIMMCINSERFSEWQRAWTAGVSVLIILPYFLVSAIPHAWNNLPEDSLDFKVWKTSEYEGIFQNRPEYVKVLEKFNLRDSAIVRDEVLKSVSNPDLKKILEAYQNSDLSEIVKVLETAQQLGREKQTPQYQALALESRKAKERLYDALLYPKQDNRNSEKIYRMGTFMTYYITQNRTRYFDDSLISAFGTYFKGKDRDATAENLKKLGIRYLLVDLNAATIDQDPRRDLTRRYEEVLDFIKTDKVKLIATDSLCLQLALELKSDGNYMNLAGTNYVSFVKDESGGTRAIMPNAKTEFCGKVIAQIIMENRVSENEFTFLQPIAQYVVSNKPKSQEDALRLILPYIGRTWMAAFEILP